VRAQRLCAAVVAGLLLLASSATRSSAGKSEFVPNFGAWHDLPPRSKESYVAGAFDALLLPGTPEDNADERGFVRCVADAGLTPMMIAELVGRRYAQHTEEWAYGPASVLVAALIDTCKTQMNDERRKSGLSPYP
jgi:hypothetical protein